MLAAHPLKQHLGRAGLGEPAGELLAVIGQHLRRNPVYLHRGCERIGDRPARRYRQHRGDDHVPGMVIDAGQQLALAAISQQDPPTRSSRHSAIGVSRCHRRYLRLCRCACGMTIALRTSTRCTVARDGAPATARCASSHAIRRAPHRGCARRNSHTSASTSAASRAGEARGRRDASRKPSIPPAACRAFQVYADWRDTPYRTATSLADDPSKTSSTARSRCSASHSRSCPARSSLLSAPTGCNHRDHAS